MEPLTLKTRQPVEDEIERWDDDADFDGFDDIQLRTASTTTSSTTFSIPHLQHRDSISSRLSVKSDQESNYGEEDWQVLLADDENGSTKDAIALAKSKGIPIPADVPKSALEGGTIRRLGGKKIKRALGDDWTEDLELPGMGAELKLVKSEDREFPDTLRQISAAFHKAPVESLVKAKSLNPVSAKSKAAPVSLDQFRDDDNDDFGDVPTIKVAKSRPPQSITQVTQQPAKKDLENIEDDLELPKDGELKLAPRKFEPRTPQPQDDDIDIEWAEGSLGTRHGGTKREFRSDRSSSVSALSPSVSSCLTAESEDEGLDCLILPFGPLKLDEKLKNRQQVQSPPASIFGNELGATKPTTAAAKDDFFDDFDFGEGDVFDSGKLTLNRNVKHKTLRTTSPQRRTAATTLTFTNTKSPSTLTRIPVPRPRGSRDGPRSTLEPVSESGPATARYKRSESRLSGAQANVSSIPAPALPSAPSTPSRRGLRSQASTTALRGEAVTTTNAQLLRSKRSMPVMRGLTSPTKPVSYPRPPSRHDAFGMGARLNMTSRPKTPTDRPESRSGDSRKHAPFLPAGVSNAQSKHGSMKTSTTTTRHFRRNDSGDLTEGAPRPFSRLSQRPETPGRGATGRHLAAQELALAAKKTITKPTRKRNFGDGSELEIFDDLPTSATTENKFMKQPVGRGAPRSLRSKLGMSHLAPSTSSLTSRTEDASPATPLSPTKQMYPDHTPRFARDTAASRNAREQRNVSASINATLREPAHPRESGPLAPLPNWKAHVMARSNANGLASPNHRKKHSTSKKEPQKPQLIKSLCSGVNEPKKVGSMQYNPALFRWEGNENALAPFDAPASSVGSPVRTRDGSSPNGKSPNHSTVGQPALITNVGQITTGVQVVGGMVFDPKRMCWLKMAPSQEVGPGSGSTSLRGGAVGSVQLEEEEDVFAGLEDLKEEDELTNGGGFGPGPSLSGFKGTRKTSAALTDGEGKDGSGSGDEGWMLSEEFDVGPEFVRRQRVEEERWKKKVERWLRPDALVEDRHRGSWRWAIRDVVSGL